MAKTAPKSTEKAKDPEPIKEPEKTKQAAPPAPVATPQTGTAVAGASEMEGFSGAGLENVTAANLIIPRITILQKISYQLDEDRQEYIKGAEAGDICDVGTGELFQPPLLYLPVYFLTQWLEWADRSTGKGLVKIHDKSTILEECKTNDLGQSYRRDNGNLVQETAQFYGLNLSSGGRRSFIPMASTQLKNSRKWLTLATAEKVRRTDGSVFTPPLFYRSYNLGLVKQSNAKGNWFGWKIERADPLETMGADWKNLFKECIAYMESIKRGEIKGEVSQLDPDEGNEGAEKEYDPTKEKDQRSM